MAIFRRCTHFLLLRLTKTSLHTALASLTSSSVPPAFSFAFPTPSAIRTRAASAPPPAFSRANLQTIDAEETMSSASGPVRVPLIPPRTLDELVECASSFCAARGLQVEVPGGPGGAGSHVAAPISLLPQSYPLPEFRRATTLAAPFNELVDRISRDGEFLKETLQDVRGVDEYTGKLLELYEEIYLGERKGAGWGEHARNADRLGIQRSDYMLHRSGEAGEYALKQVELNTIASSFAGLASTVADLHGFLTGRMGAELKEFLGENERAVMGTVGEDAETGDDVDAEGGQLRRGVPASPALARLPAGIAAAHGRYVERFAGDGGSARPVALFVVQPNETNTVDQRMLEFALWERHGIPVVRMSLAQIHDRVALDEGTGRLSFGDNEVAVVYFRAGYAPTDYPSGYDTAGGSGVEWLARERLERGRAAKCPCLGYHLAGTKKVQQALARPGAVERFFPLSKGDEAARIRTAFAGLYSLGADANEEDKAAVGRALLGGGEGGHYVLKPQREGGGYNYYGDDLAAKLQENCTATGDGVELGPALSEFILMERLFPPQQRAVLLRGGRVEGEGMTISELGCFGTIVATGEGEVVHNEYAGFLLRTKFSGVDEGGVASGFATLSSPYLC